MITKKSKLSKYNLQAIKKTLHSKDKKALTSLGFQERGQEFVKRKNEKLQAVTEATQPHFTPSVNKKKVVVNMQQMSSIEAEESSRFVKLFTDSLVYEEKRQKQILDH